MEGEDSGSGLATPIIWEDPIAMTWTESSSGNRHLAGIYASPLGAAGRVYLPGRNGVTVVLKLSDKLEVLATSRLEEKFDASPAAVGRDLFLSGHDYLYCLTQK